MELKLSDFEISPIGPPDEMARRIRLAFKRMPEEAALIVFAKVMTSDMPHDMKVAVWDDAYFSTTQAIRQVEVEDGELTEGRRWLCLLTQCRDERIDGYLQEKGLWGVDKDFLDANGNNLLWYLTYRDDQQAEGGFACPKTASALIDLGVDPNHRNKLGLCWNDVARHVNRPTRI